MSCLRDSHTAYINLDTDMSNFSHYRGAAHESTFPPENYLTGYQHTAFTRMPWDCGMYGVDPYYQTLFPYGSFHGSSAFFPRAFKSFYMDEEKPNQSYIGLIGQAIMSSPEKKMVLSNIYKWVLLHYPYFRNKGPGWKNSVRHNLSLNDCFVKAGRSPNGKGNYWAINPENYDDFRKGDFRRRKSQRRSRKCMELSTRENGESMKQVSLSTPEQHTINNVENEDCVKKQNLYELEAPKEDTKIHRIFDVENLLRMKSSSSN